MIYDGSGSYTSYVYDGEGNRIKRTVGTTTTVYVAGMEIEFHSGTENHRTVYYAAGGVFRVIGGADAGLYFRLSDHLGSTSVISDASGIEISNSRIVFAPFGEIRAGTLNALTDFGFTGQRLDRDDGLMYYGARYYLPSIQHFVSADTMIPIPVNPQAWNRYAYSYNNPLKFTDPSGHDPQNSPENQECQANTACWFENELKKFNVTFDGLDPSSDDYLEMIHNIWLGVYDVAIKLAGKLWDQASNMYEAYTLIFKETKIHVTDDQTVKRVCADSNIVACNRGDLRNGPEFRIWRDALLSGTKVSGKDISAEMLLVHEIGHTFTGPTCPLGQQSCDTDFNGNEYIYNLTRVDGGRTAAGNFLYYAGSSGGDAELTADSFLNWVFDSFKDEESRRVVNRFWRTALSYTIVTQP